MDVDQRLNEIRYLAGRAMDVAASDWASGEAWDDARRALREFLELDGHLGRSEQLPEPWADAARHWDYTSAASRQHYAKTGAYLRPGEAEVLACRDGSCEPASAQHAPWCQHFREQQPKPRVPLPPNVLPFRQDRPPEA
jgi:hypothetical protein